MQGLRLCRLLALSKIIFGFGRPSGACETDGDAFPGLRPLRHPSDEDLSPGTLAAADLPRVMLDGSLRERITKVAWPDLK
jgi:hypothetical protein